MVQGTGFRQTEADEDTQHQHPEQNSGASAVPGRQLQAAEGWLKDHPNDPGLLLTLGRLCLQNSLWGKARDYLESSLRLQRNPEACAELARLLAQLGDAERSNQLFQEGLGLLDERLLAAPLPVPAQVLAT